MRHHSWAAGRRIRKGRGGSRGGDNRGGRCGVEERARLKGTEREMERESLNNERQDTNNGQRGI